MKQTIQLTLIILSALLSSCAALGIYSGKHVHKAEQKARVKGLAEGRAIEVRARHMEDQQKLEQPQPQSTYYNIPIPAHTLRGIQYDAHTKPIKIITR